MASENGYTFALESVTYRSMSFCVTLFDDHVTTLSGNTYNYICLIISEGDGSIWDNVYQGHLLYKGPWIRCAPDVAISSGVVTGIVPGGPYKYGFLANNSGTDNWGTGCTATSMTYTAPPIPIKWSWTESNGDATAEQTVAAYTAVTEHGASTDFPYPVWNDIVNKVVEIERGYNTHGSVLSASAIWNSEVGYLTYSTTLTTDSDKVLTADRFNSLRHQIDLHYLTSIDAVSKGDIVYGSYFASLTDVLSLTDYINAWIDQL